MAALMMLAASPAWATKHGDDHFKNGDNFDAYSIGNGKIHFKVLIYAEGSHCRYRAGRGYTETDSSYPEKDTGTRIFTHVEEAGDNYPNFIHYWADDVYNRPGIVDGWPRNKGRVWFKLHEGVIDVTNAYDGMTHTYTASDEIFDIGVKRSDSGERLTYFEFDWYPPTRLDDKEFIMEVYSDHHKRSEKDYETSKHKLGTFMGAEPDEAPMLSDPFFYAVNENGVAGFGKAAAIYTSIYDVEKYYTSLDETEKKAEQNSDIIFVNTEDSVQSGFRICMQVHRSTDDQLMWRWSNKVNIPAYHKIHDFAIDGVKSQDPVSGMWFINYRSKLLSWKIYHPFDEDLMENDIFEIQRAYHSDFSDAETIGVLTMERDTTAIDTTGAIDVQTYTFLDTVPAAWWNPVENTYQIYYRVRRASSAQWGWTGHDYAVSLAYKPTQEYSPFIYAKDLHYTLAEDFATSHQVNLSLALPNKNMNAERSEEKPGFCYYYLDPNQRFILRKILSELEDTVDVDIPKENIQKAIDAVRLNADNDAYMNGAINILYTETATTPCVHYKYEVYIDTTDVTVYRPDKDYPTPRPVNPASEADKNVYFTEAANINTFAGSHQDYSDYVLLTWEPTDGDVGTYTVETRPNDTTAWKTLVSGLKNNWYKDTYADPEIAAEWQYQLTMTYVCNGNTMTGSAKTTGGRNPYGKISGRVTYSDGTGCANLLVTATHINADTAEQAVYTDENGYYMLDSVRYGGDAQYVVTPVHQKAKFTYNGIESPANITLSLDRCIASNINFTNISSVRMTGRVLYENTTIPVRDANFLLNGIIVKTNGSPYKTDASGNFDFYVPKGIEFTLQAVKEGHWFKGDGFVYAEGDNRITIEESLPAVRIYDQTKVRLIGRLAGGNNQASLPLGHGLSINYLGDDLKMLFELEGDNISHIVHFQDDESIKEVNDTVETTAVLFEKKRITIKPDVLTGEYAVDLFPVKYKITQATASGYATLFAKGKTTETLDLTSAPMKHGEDIYEEDTVRYNETYSITYHSPVSISCKQLKYGRELDFYGEETMKRQNVLNEKIQVPLVEKQADGSYTYLFGAPVFGMDNYDFRVTAHEDYYYNNDPTSTMHEEVRIKGGTLKVYNGMHDATNTEIERYELDTMGHADISIPVDYVSFFKTGENALRVLDLSVEYEGDYVESQAIRAYVAGDKLKGKDFTAATHGSVVLLDILRDPPGSHSSAYLEAGTSYTYNYSVDLKLTFGLNLTLKYGTGPNMFMGAFAGMGGGVWTGTQTEVTSSSSISLPIVSNFVYKHSGSYTFTTSERISTANDPYSVGAAADVYIGSTQNILYGIMDAVQPLDSLTYATLSARAANGTMRTVAEGRDAQGNKYYLVIGSELGAKTYISSTFVYTQDFIENVLLQQLQQQRDALLMTTDSATVASIVASTGQPAYWSKVGPDDPNFGSEGYYVQILPDDDNIYDDEVDSYNRLFTDWVGLLVQNEREKINALRGSNGKLMKTWAFGGATTVSHSETYNYSNTTAKKFYFPGLSLNSSLPTGDVKTIGGQAPSLVNMMEQAFKNLQNAGDDATEVAGKTAAASWKFQITPIVDLDWNMSPATSGTSHSKSTGFTLAGDDLGLEYMNVSVYRVVDEDHGFNDDSEGTRDFTNARDSLYGSYVYFINGGATRCPWEKADSSRFFSPKMPLSGGTLKLENPKLDISVHERSNVPADQPAIFNLKLTNEGELPYGNNTNVGMKFLLKLVDGSNPKGAKIFIDGAPLLEEGREIRIYYGQILNKTVEVYAGEDYDYENLSLALVSTCELSNAGKCTFSVHYMPVACPVSISAPHDKWIMNTLSPQDSAGWYLPVVIDGFDVNYRGFDHIEFQYKLSTQSDEAWVNLCSYYADEELYNQASGNKAMMNAGRIDNIRFYGERDPMEQQYDLRAVAFCRHGSSFITRNSAVLTGVKDTRVPRVFGQPEPADAILGVGDNLTLRFNEPIAGNYLDEDNNFQVLGVINSSDVYTETALNFSGSISSYASSEVKRGLSKSFSIDMLVKPDDPDKEEIFFMHGNNGSGLIFGKTADNRLYLLFGVLGTKIMSDTLPSRITSFQRVIATYNHETGNVRFYVGSLDVTDAKQTTTVPKYKERGVLLFGYTYGGSMLEARIWSKALTTAEILNTDGYLTGYEQELLAYYPMNEGKGETLTDKANGADLYATGTSWNRSKGISLSIQATDSVELAGDLLARNGVQDATYMFWFRTAQSKGQLFHAPTAKFSLGFNNDNLTLRSGFGHWPLGTGWADNAWHHFVLCISRTYNHVAVYVDDVLVQQFSAKNFGSISGRMFFGGSGFEGHVDELAVFEQALPKSLVDNYGICSPHGDEMGLVGYLPFEEMKENESAIMELVFSVNDHREIIENGKVIEMHDPLVLDDISTLTGDKDNYAPVGASGHLSKLSFDWSFNIDELMINLKMLDKEINKQSVYVTVRDVEDLNGNPMTSPVTWTAFVDRNALKWGKREIAVEAVYGEDDLITRSVRIMNTSGKRHQYEISSMPSWLSIDAVRGSLEPTEEVTLTFTFDPDMAPGEYGDILYLTDENGLSEPLHVELTIGANPPYSGVDKGKYDFNMAICAQVLINDTYDIDPNDIFYALYYNECVGMAHVDFDSYLSTSQVYLTVYGNDTIMREPLRFQLWRASTGKLYNMTADSTIIFTTGAYYGCGSEEPLVFHVSGTETQNIPLDRGWNWISTNLRPQPATARFNDVITASEPWREGDVIKEPSEGEFNVFSAASGLFLGTLEGWDFTRIYMVYTALGNTLLFNGDPVQDEDKHVSLRGDGQWNAVPCFFDEVTPLSQALADYFERATPGDVVKSHDQFAVFSHNKRWEGDLKTFHPGMGYMLRRNGVGTVKVNFYSTPSNAPRKVQSDKVQSTKESFTNPSASTNMTLIARIEGMNELTNERLNAYIGDELVGVAHPISLSTGEGRGEALYFLTIQSDAAGSAIRFETEDGIVLTPVSLSTGEGRGEALTYVPDAHHGSLKAPVMLTPDDELLTTKFLRDGMLFINHNGKTYTATGVEVK